MKVVAESEPPSCSPVFILGQDNRGNWVVRDQNGLGGGLFVGCKEALRYVRSEAGNRLRAVVMVNEALERHEWDEAAAHAKSAQRRRTTRASGRVIQNLKFSMTIGRHVWKLSGYARALPTPFDENDAVASR